MEDAKQCPHVHLEWRFCQAITGSCCIHQACASSAICAAGVNRVNVQCFKHHRTHLHTSSFMSGNQVVQGFCQADQPPCTVQYFTAIHSSSKKLSLVLLLYCSQVCRPVHDSCVENPGTMQQVVTYLNLTASANYPNLRETTRQKLLAHTAIQQLFACT